MNSLKREIITTADGSVTIRLPEWDECYHSKHGAVQEAKHVFIQNGLSLFQGQPVSILEIGFGTGLNAFITAIEAENNQQQISYTGIEAFPVSPDEAAKLNYADAVGNPEKAGLLQAMHRTEWNQPETISDYFMLEKIEMKFQDIELEEKFDLIYFDAFGFRVQPELWSSDIFARMYKALKPNGLLVTYAARTIIRDNMRAAGFQVVKRPGPPGKREMMQGLKGTLTFH